MVGRLPVSVWKSGALGFWTGNFKMCSLSLIIASGKGTTLLLEVVLVIFCTTFFVPERFLLLLQFSFLSQLPLFKCQCLTRTQACVQHEQSIYIVFSPAS